MKYLVIRFSRDRGFELRTAANTEKEANRFLTEYVGYEKTRTSMPYNMVRLKNGVVMFEYDNEDYPIFYVIEPRKLNQGYALCEVNLTSGAITFDPKTYKTKETALKEFNKQVKAARKQNGDDTVSDRFIFRKRQGTNNTYAQLGQYSDMLHIEKEVLEF